MADLTKPLTREHPRFGTFTFDPSVDWWTAETQWGETPIQLHLRAPDDESFHAAIREAVLLWEDQPRWERRIRDCAVRHLLPLKNSDWLDEDEEPITQAAFEERMTLESIEVDAEGAFDFWHDDGELFWGHAIKIVGVTYEGPTGADICG